MEAVISKVLEQHHDDASTDNRSVLAKFQLMLQRLGVDASAPPKLADVSGRVGPDIVEIHKPYCYGGLEIEHDLRVAAKSNFSTARTNVAVFSGKYQYECVVLTGGLCQVGWSTLSSKFTMELGVGDTPCSYAYDGDRKKKWSVDTSDYGSSWGKGDVIGCVVDLDAKTMSFYRNGVDMGIAFDNVQVGPGIAYFPSASISFGESVRFNFGSTPFAFPVEGYQPVCRSGALVAKESQAVGQMLEILQQVFEAADVGDISPKEWAMLCAGVWSELGQVLLSGGDFVIAERLIPFFKRMRKNSRTFALLLKSLILFNHDMVWTSIMEKMFTQMAHSCVSQSFNSSGSSNLDLVMDLLENQTVYEAFCSLPKCHFLLEDFFMTKSPSEDDLIQYLGEGKPVWRNHSYFDILEEEKDGKTDSPSKMNTSISDNSLSEVEGLHTSLFTHEAKLQRLSKILFEKQGSSLYSEFCESLVRRNMDIQRNPPPIRSTSDSVFLNVFFCSIKLLLEKGYFEKNVSLRFLVKPDSDQELTRLGGLLSHLQKESPLDAEVFGPDAPSEEERKCFVVLDSILMIFHLVLNSKYRISELSMKKFKDMNRDFIKKHDNQNSAPKETLGSFKSMVRNCIWNSLMLHSPVKQELLCQAFGFVIKNMNHVSDRYPIAFGYFPQYYLEFSLDTFRPLFFNSLPKFDFTSTLMRRGVLDGFVTFLVAHINDARVANPEIRDVLMQQLNHFLSTSRFAIAVASNAVAQEKLLSMLMENANRNWVAVSSILLRFWIGKGFGKPRGVFNEEKFPEIVEDNAALDAPSSKFFGPNFKKKAPLFNSTKKNSANASPVFQKLMQDLCRSNVDLVADFLNQLFNTLNWCVSEFTVGISEYKTALERRKDHHQIQKKVIIMFELSSNLIRLLEIIVMHGGNLFLSSEYSGAHVNLQRTAEAMLSIFDRTILFPEKKTFNFILMRQNLLNEINENSIAFPTLGVLLGLFAAEGGKELLPAALAEQAGLNEGIIAYWETTKWEQEVKLGSSAETDEWVKLMPEFIKLTKTSFEKHKEQEKTGLQRIDSLEVCPICYAGAIDTRFLPCEHTSCNDCITRHLLNSKRCFFCNTQIDKTEPIAK